MKILIKDMLLWMYWYPFRAFLQCVKGPACYKLAKNLSRLIVKLMRGKQAQYAKEWNTINNYRKLDESLEASIEKTVFCKLCNEFEVFLFSQFNENNIDNYITIENISHMDEALKKGKGAILLLTHFGANQMVMPAVGHRGYKMNQLSASPLVWPEKMPDRKFSKLELITLKIRDSLEQALPANHINIFGSIRPAYKCLQNNEVLGLATDGGGGATRVQVNMLGHKASFSTGAVELAIRTGAALIPTFVIRNDDGTNRMILEKPLDIQKEEEGDKTVIKSYQKIAGILEKYILEYPAHYLDFMALRRMMHEKHGDEPYLQQ